MSAGEGILKFLLIGEDKSASSALKKVGETASTTSDHIGALGRAGDVMNGILGSSMILGAIDGIKNLGMTGLATAANMETAQIGFSTMLGSGEKAQAFLKDLAGFAAATPFEFPELQTAASSLISIGIDSSKVIPIMTTLGNVTSGMGTGSEGIKRATVAIQQMNAAGKIQAQDLNQLRDAGIPVYDLLAAAMGKTKEEVAGLANSGKLGKDALDKMMGALESGKGLERFNGLMDKQSQSLSGLWSTFSDNLNMGLANAIGPLVPMLKDGLGGAASFLSETVMPNLATAFTWVIDNAKGLAQWAQDTGVSSSLEGVFIIVQEAVGKLGSVFKDVGDWITAHSDMFADITNNVLLFVQNGIAVGIDAVSNIRDALERAAGWVKANQEWLAPLAISVGVLVTGIKAYELAMGLGAAATKVWAAATKAFAVVQGALNVVMSMNPIALVVIGIAALAAGLIYAYQHSEKFREVCDAAFKAIGAAGIWLWNNALQPVIKFLVDGFSTVMRWVADLLSALGNVPGFGWAKDAADKMRTAADKAHDLANGINKIPENKEVTVTVSANYSAVTAAALGLQRATMNAGHRAAGGPTTAGSPYIVGENGPELWIPDQDGMVINASQTAALRRGGPSALGGGSGGDSYVIHVVPTPGTDPQAYGRAIETALVELQRNARGGRALAFQK